MYLKVPNLLFSADSGSATGSAGAEAPQPLTLDSATPEAVSSLSLEEFNQFKAGAKLDSEESAAPSSEQAGESVEDTDDVADAAAKPAGSERGEEVKTNANEGQGKRKQYSSVEEAIRDLDALRGNLNSTVEERRQLQERIAAYEAREAAAKQEQEAAAMRAQFQQAEQAIAQLPSRAEQEAARTFYQNQLKQQALNEYQQFLQGQQAEIQQSRLSQAKDKLPDFMGEIAEYVAKTHQIDGKELLAFTKSEQVRNLIAAAKDEEALTAVAATVGELLDFQAQSAAAQQAAAKTQRRADAARNPGQRDAPNGAGAGGSDSEAQRVERMSREEFFAYKADLARKSRR